MTTDSYDGPTRFWQELGRNFHIAPELGGIESLDFDTPTSARMRGIVRDTLPLLIENGQIEPYVIEPGAFVNPVVLGALSAADRVVQGIFADPIYINANIRSALFRSFTKHSASALLIVLGLENGG